MEEMSKKKYLVRTYTVTDLGRTPFGDRDVCKTNFLFWAKIKGWWESWCRQGEYPTGDEWIQIAVGWEVVNRKVRIMKDD